MNEYPTTGYRGRLLNKYVHGYRKNRFQGAIAEQYVTELLEETAKGRVEEQPERNMPFVGGTPDNLIIMDSGCKIITEVMYASPETKSSQTLKGKLVRYKTPIGENWMYIVIIMHEPTVHMDALLDSILPRILWNTLHLGMEIGGKNIPFAVCHTTPYMMQGEFQTGNADAVITIPMPDCGFSIGSRHVVEWTIHPKPGREEFVKRMLVNNFKWM